MTSAEAATLISDCEAREQCLSAWEREFIDSIGRQVAAGRTLSQKQADRLEEVWERVTSEVKAVRR